VMCFCASALTRVWPSIGRPVRGWCDRYHLYVAIGRIGDALEFQQIFNGFYAGKGADIVHVAAWCAGDAYASHQ